MKYFNEEQISKIVSKLINDTRSGILEWRESDVGFELDAGEKIVGKAYFTELNNRFLRIYKYKYKSYLDIDKWSWGEGYKLEFTDINGNSEWKFPSANSIADLYDSVTYQISDVDNFLDDYLED